MKTTRSVKMFLTSDLNAVGPVWPSSQLYFIHTKQFDVNKTFQILRFRLNPLCIIIMPCNLTGACNLIWNLGSTKKRSGYASKFSTSNQDVEQILLLKGIRGKPRPASLTHTHFELFSECVCETKCSTWSYPLGALELPYCVVKPNSLLS